MPPGGGALQQTVGFEPVVARFFRVKLQRPAASELQKLGLAAPRTAYEFEELVLHSGARVNRFEDKAGFSVRQIVDQDDTPTVAAMDAVPQSAVVDVTSRMRADGSLNWTPPAGRWKVLRFGYSLIGRTNHPAEFKTTRISK